MDAHSEWMDRWGILRHIDLGLQDGFYVDRLEFKNGDVGTVHTPDIELRMARMGGAAMRTACLEAWMKRNGRKQVEAYR